MPYGPLAGYILGSYADGSEVLASDLDLTVVVRDEGERLLVESVADRAAPEVELDWEILTVHDLAGGISPMLKWGSRLVYGEDVCASAPPIPIDEWGRERMHAAYYLLVSVFDRAPLVPIGPPDPAGTFLGYDNRLVRLQDGTIARSTRNLIRVTGWIATALLAHRAGRYVSRKSECHTLYRAHIGDEWSSLLEELYTWCRVELGCLLPDGERDRERLRALCERVVAFENHFLRIYLPFLRAELDASPAGDTNRAHWIMHHVAPVIGGPETEG